MNQHFLEILPVVLSKNRETLLEKGYLLVDEGIDMPFLLGFVDLVEGHEYACLLGLAEFMIDSATEHLHGRGEAHI